MNADESGAEQRLPLGDWGAVVQGSAIGRMDYDLGVT